ncbi:MAG: prepilin-type N-terminal cleavage/methylation domain-containing protein [Candidatus Saccharimonadales bacterium]
MGTRLNRQGFSLAESLLVIIIIAILGFAGWFVYSSQRSTDKTFKETGKSTAARVKENDVKDASILGKDKVDTQRYLFITEWGVKIQLRDASKVHYKYTSQPNGSYYGSPYDSNVEVVANAGQIQDKTCSSDIGALLRSTEKPTSVKVNDSMSVGGVKQVGGYYYWTTGGDLGCGTTTDRALISRIDTDSLNIELL